MSDLPVITVNVFPGGFNWPLYVAQDKGFFSDQGMAVAIQDTPDSVTQMTDFSLGKFDIAMTAIDNIVAYVEGQGQAPIGPQPEFFAFMGSDSGFLSLVSAPTIKRIEDFKGKDVAVDATTTGYAFVLYEILRLHGLDKEAGEYGLVRAGGMIQRWNALREGRYAGTLLSAPYNLVAEAAGFPELVKATDVIGPYQGNVAATRRSWADKNPDKIAGYTRAYRSAVAWLYEPSHETEAVQILRRHLPNMPEEAAAASYAELLHPARGFFKSTSIDPAGVECVLALRDRYARPPKTLANADRYYQEVSA